MCLFIEMKPLKQWLSVQSHIGADANISNIVNFLLIAKSCDIFSSTIRKRTQRKVMLTFL